MAGDLEEQARLSANYRVGPEAPPAPAFVFESELAAHLVEFRLRYGLDQIASGHASEYAAMLALATWVSKQFDHGDDRLPSDSRVCDPVSVIEAGRSGRKFWCEIASRTLAHAAAAVGWPARVITGSTDGYTWEHAVTELWSNQFNKWIVIDADFNVVFEVDGTPLSAYELMRDGPRLSREGRLRQRLFTPSKPSLPLVDLLPLFSYVHVDMRTDWCSRRLRRGSPAGGDLSTLWDTRPSMPPLLSPSPRAPNQAAFDWPLNQAVATFSEGPATDASERAVRMSLSTYSPVFKAFEYRLDSGEWASLSDGAVYVDIPPETKSVFVRVVTRRGDRGPETRVIPPTIAKEKTVH